MLHGLHHILGVTVCGVSFFFHYVRKVTPKLWKLWSAVCIVAGVNRVMAWRKCVQSLQNKKPHCWHAKLPLCFWQKEKHRGLMSQQPSLLPAWLLSEKILAKSNVLSRRGRATRTFAHVYTLTQRHACLRFITTSHFSSSGAFLQNNTPVIPATGG